ncbi:flavonol sulfotransferase-like protein, partial [Trifolium pratense]
MFYSHQLHGPKAPLQQICEQIQNPAIPMAPRISGILMGGVLNVFQSKVDMLYDDISCLLVEVDEALEEVKSAPIPTMLPKGKSRAKRVAITLRDKEHMPFKMEQCHQSNATTTMEPNFGNGGSDEEDLGNDHHQEPLDQERFVSATMDQTSPFYVHPSDGPSSVCVLPKLTSSNYHSWAQSMTRALGGKMKLEFVDGTIDPVTDSFDPSYRAWNRCNMLVLSWILNSVSDSIAQSIVFMENAVDVWIDLKERFSQGDLVRISELMQEIYAMQQETKSVTEFYSDLKILWEELEIYIPIPNCSCRTRCSCESMRSAQRNHTLLYAIRFLTGLNENFNMVKSQILLMDPLPPMNKIFSMVLQHERQGNFAPSEESKVLINAADSSKSKGFHSGKSNFHNGNGFPKGTNRVCTFCGKS